MAKVAREFVQNVLASDIGTKFNIVGGERGDPVVFARREQTDPGPRIDALKQAGYVGVFKTDDNFALVPVQP